MRTRHGFINVKRKSRRPKGRSRKSESCNISYNKSRLNSKGRLRNRLKWLSRNRIKLPQSSSLKMMEVLSDKEIYRKMEMKRVSKQEMRNT